MERTWLGLLAWAAILLTAATGTAQHEPPQHPSPSAAEHKRGSKTPPTHRPTSQLPPALALHHLRRSNTAVATAHASHQPTPKPLRRPTGAGRYLCAVFVCPDADVDPAAVLGLERRDVLVFANPGPFVSREAVALLEQQIDKERLPLIVVMTHADCATTKAEADKSSQQSVLAERIAATRRRARAQGYTLAKALARSQRELLLASSKPIQRAAAKDLVRVVAAEVHPRTKVVTWHTRRAEELPMPVIK